MYNDSYSCANCFLYDGLGSLPCHSYGSIHIDTRYCIDATSSYFCSESPDALRQTYGCYTQSPLPPPMVPPSPPYLTPYLSCNFCYVVGIPSLEPCVSYASMQNLCASEQDESYLCSSSPIEARHVGEPCIARPFPLTPPVPPMAPPSPPFKPPPPPTCLDRTA